MAKQQQDEPEETSEQEEVRDSRQKSGPTPTRAEREAANRRPLIVDKKAHKERMRKERQKAQAGLARGDERYLMPRDRGPQRRYARDWIDARFNVGEILIPSMIVVIILMSMPNPTLIAVAMLAMWGLVVITVLDCFWLSYRLKKKIEEKHGTGSLEKGVRWYASMRAIQLRILRLPKPQRKYGDWPN